MVADSARRRELEDWGRLVLRIAIGGLLLLHGIAKLASGVAWMAGPLGALGLPGFIAYGVFIGEIVAPVLLLVGKFTRPAGLVIAFNMLMAILLVLRDRMFQLKEQGGGLAVELELLFLLGGVALALLGSGRFALSRGTGRWD